MRQKVRTFAAEEPLSLSEKCPHWTNPLPLTEDVLYGQLLITWSENFFHQGCFSLRNSERLQTWLPSQSSWQQDYWTMVFSQPLTGEISSGDKWTYLVFVYLY